MKKIFLIILLVLGLFAGLYLGYIYSSKSESGRSQKTAGNKIQVTGKIKKSRLQNESLFVPYWSLADESGDLENFNELIYFGITPDYYGINENEPGYRGIEKFNTISAGKKKLLTVRLTDQNISLKVLENTALQEKIITQSLEIVEQNSFSGIVLDLEISGIFNDGMTDQINKFVQFFYSRVNNNYRKFYLTVYGDNFYRKRPFDLQSLSKNSDGILIMAYDFHKSRGEPGPNFPLDSGRQYAYSFKSMVSDFLKYVPADKITVIFGMFGYDWLVDEKKRPITQAKALSLNEIRKKFLDKCEFKNCVNKRDPVSGESEVDYIVSADKPDDQQIYRIDYHIVWFEDEQSVKAKTGYLQSQGIGNIAFWVSGYF